MEDQDKNVLTITRVFDAPVETIWRYWTEPEMYKKWWGPKDFTGAVKEMDVRVGGKLLGYMEASIDQGPVKKGQKFWSTGEYKEIVPMEKLVVTDSFADENGNVISAENYGMKGFPLEMLVTLKFENLDDKTKMTLRHSGIKDISDQERSNMKEGWSTSLDKIDQDLAK